ncbi:TetR/AcrR family transcriptional regulator [Georgenia yuyongxinii]|uniref:TetR/AcrR family transcriptional regulator n=1 Tax=Georgenia yuyongxinii TaxID=2589797 RepID=A0A5B8C8L7_9MICO|nr:TetR/AcrR family transcriptional regulator [Georgenia yuyongxinii]QDC25492.1 TetR/AcrR family transcriptional regulator [Georgenia yuyongxinii]
MTSDQGRVDPRTRRTLVALRQALGVLLETTPLNQVSVSELCRTAGIHRTTFYKHFDSVGELATSVVEDLGRRIVAPVRGAAELTYRTWLTAVLMHVAERRALYHRLLSVEGGDPALVRAVTWQVARRTERFLRDADAVPAASLPLMSRVLGYGSYALVERIMETEGPVDVEGMIEEFLAGIPADVADRLVPEPSTV